MTVNEWLRALGAVDLKLEDFEVVLDYGCGCGRALRHLEAKLLRHQHLMGADVDREAIEWLSEAYPGITALTLGNEPPMDATSESVDLILSHSVFTHLPEDTQLRWLVDLVRLLKLGGVLVTSVHGLKAFHDYRCQLEKLGRLDEIRALDAGMASTGFFHTKGRTQAELAFPEYYGAAFHHIHYILNNWLKSFSLLAWLPAFALRHQDVLVLRKVSGGSVNEGTGARDQLDLDVVEPV